MSTASSCPGSVEEIRTYWQVPSIAHFIYLFKDGLKLSKSDYHDLEISFLSPFPESNGIGNDVQSTDHILLQLIIELLKGYFNEYRINTSNWEGYLKKLCRLLWVDREGNPSPFHVYTYDQRGNKYEQEIVFSDLTLDQKVEVIYHLCEYRLYAEDSSDLVSHLVDDELRIEPLGRDGRGNVYWYFFGTRLYRENPDSVKNVDHIRESIARYRARKALEESQVMAKQEQQQQAASEPSAETRTANVRKKLKPDPIPGERSSSRISKPVDRLNGHTLTSSSKKTSDSKSRNSNSSKSSPNHQSKAGSKKQTLPEVDPDPATSCGVPLSDLKSAWDCVCDHESEWESLTESFSKSKVPCEVELYKILSKNFLPLIREVAEKERKEKEKQQKAKILELLPRRTSSRIETKKILQEEEEKKVEQEKEERKRRSAQAEERRKREEERMRLEEVRRQREERARQRLAIIEDRASRAALRKHRLNNNNVLNHQDDDSYSVNSNDPDDDVIDLTDPDVTMILSNGWPPSEHSYSSPRGYLLMKRCM